jgi:hypothetical protein
MQAVTDIISDIIPTPADDQHQRLQADSSQLHPTQVLLLFVL